MKEEQDRGINKQKYHKVTISGNINTSEFHILLVI